jgi:hypothetical protein
MKLFRPQAHVVLIGHTHYPGVWHRSGRVVINTGSFLHYMSALAVIIDGERLEVRLVNQRNGKFTLGKVKEVFKIPKSAAQESKSPREVVSSQWSAASGKKLN